MVWAVFAMAVYKFEVMETLFCRIMVFDVYGEQVTVFINGAIEESS